MAHRILFVAQTGSPAYPRYVICDTDGNIWDGSAWATVGRPLLYADQRPVSIDCANLQRQETIGKPHVQVVEIPLRAEVFSDSPIDPNELQNWLQCHLNLDIDFTSDSGPTPDSIVLGCIVWAHYRTNGESS